jgi:CubicO group peptidase (beta-lactamase class C family)
VPGFLGHQRGGPLPDLRQILDGLPPANTPAVRQQWPPGEAFRYSGGGTMVLQQLVQHATARPFAALAHELVLAPCGMATSSFGQPPATDDLATAHDAEGRALPGAFRLYPELAAAGLWSTAPELALMALSIAASWQGRGLVAQTTALMMARPVGGGPTGLGVFVQPRDQRPPRLYHYGVNAGFRSILVFDADAAFGIALMTDGEGGHALLPTFLDALFAAHGQDAFRSH